MILFFSKQLQKPVKITQLYSMLLLEVFIKQNEQIYFLYGILTNNISSPTYAFNVECFCQEYQHLLGTYMIPSGFNYLQQLKIHVKGTMNSADSSKLIQY